MNPRTLIALAGLAVIVTACGSDSKKSPTEPGGDDNTSYTASISGGYTKSLTGESAFASDNTQGDVGFALALGTESGNGNAILVWRKQAGVLATGTHQFANYVDTDEADIPANQLVAVVVFDVSAENAVLCTVTGGTLTVTESSANRLKGTLSAQASCFDATTTAEKTIAITGSFNAAGGTVTIPNG